MNLAWNEQGNPVGISIDQLLYRIRKDDGNDGLMFDSVTLDDILAEDGVEQFVFDAMVTPFSRLRRKMEQMLKVMNRAIEGLDVTAMQVSDPFRRNGVAQVAAVFELSDGQTVSVYFHNPDSTPSKLTPTDEMVSWKWLLNKKDITIVVAPEKGRDLAVREVSRRIMRLAERNGPAFARQNAQRAERLERIQGLKDEIDELEQTLEQRQQALELARVEAESRALAEKEASAEEGMKALNSIKRFLSRSQYRTIAAAMKGEEKRFFIDKARLLADIINGMAETYEQDGKGMDATAYLHYFKAGADWYITEKDSQGGTQQAFGWANLGHGGELGYISIDELTQNNAELDLHFDPQPLGSAVKADEGEANQAEDNNQAGFALVERVAAEFNGFNGLQGRWEESTGGWRYGNLLFGEIELRMGVSSGGVVSVNGKPHDPEGRVIDSENSLRAAIVAELPKDEEQRQTWAASTESVRELDDEQFAAALAELEEDNLRSEAVLLLARRKGTDEQIAEAELILQEYNEAGHASAELIARRDALRNAIEQGEPSAPQEPDPVTFNPGDEVEWRNDIGTLAGTYRGTIDDLTAVIVVDGMQMNAPLAELFPAGGEPNAEPDQALQQARQQTDTDPTGEQKESGDYQKGELSAFGLDLAIENPKGHVRSGKSASGEEWQVSMAHDYGYIKGTKGLDGDEVDAFIGPNLESEKAFVIEQVDPSGKLDEHKVMLGFDDEEAARQGYLSSYKAGWDGLGSIREMSLDELKAWLPNAANAPEAEQAPEDESAQSTTNEPPVNQPNEPEAGEGGTEPVAAEPQPEPTAEPAAEDRTFLQSVIDGTVPDILAPELGDEIAAVLERHADNPELESLLEQAVMAYQTAMLNATATIE